MYNKAVGRTATIIRKKGGWSVKVEGEFNVTRTTIRDDRGKYSGPGWQIRGDGRNHTKPPIQKARSYNGTYLFNGSPVRVGGVGWRSGDDIAVDASSVLLIDVRKVDGT